MVYVQYATEFGSSIKWSCLYIGLQVTEQMELNFPLDSGHNTQGFTQVNHRAI